MPYFKPSFPKRRKYITVLVTHKRNNTQTKRRGAMPHPLALPLPTTQSLAVCVIMFVICYLHHLYDIRCCIRSVCLPPGAFACELCSLIRWLLRCRAFFTKSNQRHLPGTNPHARLQGLLNVCSATPASHVDAMLRIEAKLIDLHDTLYMIFPCDSNISGNSF